MSEFNVETVIPNVSENVTAGQSLKNVKEIKIGSGEFYVDSTGKIELRDTAGNVVVLIDPNG